MPAPSLGDLDELVLLAVGLRHGDAYALTVKQTIQTQSGRRVALPTVHAALYRLEERGLLRSAMGGVTAERGGRRKRLYHITAAGLDALQAVRATRERMWQRLQELELGRAL